jgi:hypothetical protein
MEAWPIEEVWLRPLATLLACGALPFATTRVVRATIGAGARPTSAGGAGSASEARAGALVGAAEAVLAWLAGTTALGPALVSSPHGWANDAFGLGCVGLAAIAGARARERRILMELAPLAALAGTELLSRLATPSSGPWAGVIVLCLVHIALRLREWRKRAPADAGSSALVAAITGASLAAFLLAAPALLDGMTVIDVSRAPVAGASAARWRLRVDPWDGRAMLAAAWAARERRDSEGARAMVREAVRMGLEEAPALELEAELLAASGECDAARSTFDRALRARAATAFEGGTIGAPLTLGGYNLPPSLVTECGGLAITPP